MKVIRILALTFLEASIGYTVYLAVGMSSAHPAIPEYSFEVDKDTFVERFFQEDRFAGRLVVEKKR